MSDLTEARAALAAFDLTTRDILARRIMGKIKAAPMNRYIPGGTAHLRAALAEVERLTAEVEWRRGQAERAFIPFTVAEIERIDREGGANRAALAAVVRRMGL